MKRLALIILFTFTASLTFAQIEPFFGLNKKHGIENPILNNIVAWYDFEETSGTTMVDSSPNGQDGTIGAAVTINQTMSWGKGYSFPSGSGSGISIPDNDLFSFTDNILSVSLHIKITDMSSNAYIFNKYDAGTQNEYRLYVDYNGKVNIRLSHNGSSSSFIGHITTNSVIAENQWYHVVVVISGNSWFDNHIYVDNVDVPLTNTGTSGSGMINGTDEVSIGVQSGSGWGSFDIDQLIVSSNAWDTTDVSYLWNSGSGRLFSEVESVSYSPSAPPPIQEPGNESFLASADYYVSSSATGSGDGTDSLSNAWTLDQLNAATLIPGDTVAFKHDDIFYGSLTVSNSGDATNNIVYGAYGSGAKPIISGAEEVTGWILHSGNIYKATISANTINQVFVDGEKESSARYPNSGYFDITTVNASNSFTSNQISSSIDYSGVKAIIRTREWWIGTYSVTSYSGQQLTINTSPNYDLNVGEGFVLFNKLDFLDQAGEWYYDSSTSTLYLWTENGDSPENYTVLASVTNNAINMISKSYITIENLSLFYTNSHGVNADNLSNAIVNNCDVLYASNYGIEVDNGSSNNVILSNCNITGSSRYGIYIEGDYHEIANNNITDIGLFDEIGVSGYGGQSGTAISHWYGNNSYIQDNNITNVGYNGIHFFYSPNTTVQYNVIKNACLTIHDGGGIYCFESSTGEYSDNSVIRYNVVDNVPGNLEGSTSTLLQGAGIYLDDRISNIIVENNTITGTSYYGIYFHNNKYCTARYNTIYDCAQSYRITELESAVDNNFYNNTLCNIESTPTGYIAVTNSDYASIIGDTVNNNTYVDHHRSTPFRLATTYNFENWKSLTGWDANSTFDNSPLPAGDTEKLLYNDTKAAIDTTLTGSWKYLDGSSVAFPITIQPFESIILTGH